jgi:hypothetical protein
MRPVLALHQKQRVSRVRGVWLKLLPVLLLLAALPLSAAGVTYQGDRGPGKGKHVVLVAGDDAEYHSEEALPQLAKILAMHHGFKCTVLFSMNPADGTIDPHAQNIPGLEALEHADLLVLFIRWRDLPDDQMEKLVGYIQSGRPIMAIRTGTHPFWFKTSKTYERYSWNSTVPGWEGGFGRKVLGTTWEEQLGHYGHHGAHGKQSTRAWFAPGAEDSPILRGIKNGEIWVPTEVYEVRLPQPPTCRALLLGQVLSGPNPNDPPAPGKINDPMLPVAWTNSFTGEAGKTARVFTSTMGAADDLLNTGLRRLLVNATYWAVGLENQIPAEADVALVGDYHPHSFLSETFTPGVKPSDLALPPTSDPRR